MTTVTRPAGKPLMEITDDGTLKLWFHRHQSRVWLSTRRFIALLMGTQGGKTEFAVHWLHREIERCGPGDYLAISATFPLMNLKMVLAFLKVFRDIYKLGTWHAADKVFVFHDGETRVIFGSATNPEQIESATAKAAWLDEAGQTQFRRDTWDAVLRRLSINEGRILITTTLYGVGWLKSEVYDPWKAGDEDFDVIQGDSIDNPAFPEREYYRAQRTMPQWKFNLFYRGMFERPAGLIYDSFDEEVCKIKRFILNKDWPRYVGHDFGPQNTAAIWYAEDPVTTFWYCYRAYKDGGLSAFQHAQKWKDMSQGENIVRRVGGARHEEGWREDFTAAGWPIMAPAEFEVEVGINRVYGWHKTNKLFVFEDVGLYLDEKNTYSRVLDDNFQPTEKIANKSAFHLMDAERYILSGFNPEATVDGDDFEVFSLIDRKEPSRL
jgi:hypothetical protein